MATRTASRTALAYNPCCSTHHVHVMARAPAAARARLWRGAGGAARPAVLGRRRAVGVVRANEAEGAEGSEPAPGAMELSPEQAMELLGVGRNASFEEIVRAKNRLVEATDDMETVIKVRADLTSTSTRACAACLSFYAQGFPACVGYEGTRALQARAKPPSGRTHSRRSLRRVERLCASWDELQRPTWHFDPSGGGCESHEWADVCEIRSEKHHTTPPALSTSPMPANAPASPACG